MTDLTSRVKAWGTRAKTLGFKPYFSAVAHKQFSPGIGISIQKRDRS
jgi:hypothetical protein